jgi:hypothetical protein
VRPSNASSAASLCCAVGLALECRTLRAGRGVRWPYRIVHTDRYLFVGDRYLVSISVYSLERDWEFVRAIGSEGNDAGQFDDPNGMCVYRDRLIACDSANNRLQFIDISAADAKDWKFDAPFDSNGTAKGQFRWPDAVCETGGVLFVAESHRETNRVQTFTIAVNAATSALTLTLRSFIGGFDEPRALVCVPDAARVFVSDGKQISCIDVESDVVRLFVGIATALAMTVADGLLYATHYGDLSIVHAETIQLSAVRTLHGRSWATARGIAVLPDFICIADLDSHCVHVIPRTS